MRATTRLTQGVTGFDRAQAANIYRRALDRVPAAQHDKPVPDEQWRQWCDDRALDAYGLASDEDAIALHREFVAAADTQPDPHTARACMAMTNLQRRAHAAVRRQTEAVAALRGVPAHVAAERIAAYRAQYATTYAHMDAALRPDPPADWVYGFTVKDKMAVSAPQDPATLYAFYRAQADPGAVTSRGVRYASIDLETAAPDGKEGFMPQNGSIIEVGIVTYDDMGREVSRFQSLVKPLPGAEHTYRTGMVDVHGITWDQVANAPTWAQVAPRVLEHLGDDVLLAQNDRFERAWLEHHSQAVGLTFDRYRPGVDTWQMSLQHASDLPTHRLAAICERFGVAYTDGHRAVHDARVAAGAFFAMRAEISRRWLDSPVHAGLPQPPRAPAAVPGVRRLGQARGRTDAWSVA